MNLQTEAAGRTLTVTFKCRRCGKAVVFPFKDVMVGDHYGYLHNSKIPAGWSEVTAFGQLFCEECVKSYKQFMDAGKPNVEVNE